MFESSPNSLTRSVSLLGNILIVLGMLTCVDAIVEHPNVAVRHHVVDEADVYILPLSISIAQARIDPLGCDLRLADAAPMRTDLIRECLRTSTKQCAKRDES